jgi:hypothetical protein
MNQLIFELLNRFHEDYNVMVKSYSDLNNWNHLVKKLIIYFITLFKGPIGIHYKIL